jgi:autotransporter passenger strand-loop-strand repeat protein/uncharacterized repeat protein (TIGR03803 family)
VSGDTVQSGGLLTVNAGATDSATIISAGGNETELGSANGDQIYGTQLVSGLGATATAVVTSETVYSGGNLNLFLKGAIASATVVSSGGNLNINGSAFASNTTLSGGGFIDLESAKATLTGSLVFAGGNNTLVISSVASNGTVGDLATISGFSSTDKIDVSLLNPSAGSAGLSFTSSGGNETVKVSGTGGSETFIFARTSTYTSNTLAVISNGGHEYVEYSATGFSSSGGTVTSVTTSTTSSYTETSGNTLLVSSGGSVSAPTIQNGAFLIVNGGTDTGAIISAGGTETVSSGAASSDSIYGNAAVDSGVTVTSETVQGGGTLAINSGATETSTTISAGGLETVASGGFASGDKIYGSMAVLSTGPTAVHDETVYSGGTLTISKSAFVSNTTLSDGGKVVFLTQAASLDGSLTFAGTGNEIVVSSFTNTVGANGDLAPIVGFTSGDLIDFTAAAIGTSAVTLSSVVSGGNLYANLVSGGTVLESFVFSGTALSGGLALVGDGSGGLDLEVTPTSVTTTVATSTGSGAYTENATDTLLVLNGGSVSAPTIDGGAFLIVNGGTDTSATILSGGLETVSAGSATGDQIFGSAVLSGGTVSNETVMSGGVLTVGATSASNVILSGGGTADLASATSELTGSLSFTGGHNTLEVSAISNNGAGDQAAITGFTSNDKIDVTGISPTGANLSFTTNGAGQSVATIAGTGGSESFIFANPTTYNASTMSLVADGSGGVDLVLDTTPVVTFTSLGGTTNTATQIVNGTVNTNLDPQAIGTTVSVFEGTTVVGTATVGSNGYWAANVSFQNDDGTNVLTASDTDTTGKTGTTSQSLTYSTNTSAAAFAAGNLVVSISGDGAGTGSYGDNQAAPITLEQFTTTGTYVSQLVLPQTTTVVNGVTEYNISGEYGSSSEGTLELSADGHSLVIAGYGVNAVTYNTGGASVYGNAALAQSTSLQGGQYTAVPRVIADINANGTVDTSTALYNIDNTNNPRSVATIDGSSFYIDGQGVKGDTTQGVFLARDGASSATAIDTSTDTRTLEIYNGQLYVSRDSTQGTGGTSNISTYGTSLPTGATAPIVLPGISQNVTLSNGNGNSLNGSTGTVDLSPENFYFANSTTLYIADGGNPKEGTAGDGGLQKWSLVNGTWQLDYTLTNGLGLIANPSISTDTAGSTGLIGLTGEVVNGQVELFATNSTIGDLDQTYLYGITDTLGDTTAAQASGEAFTVLATAAPDTNIRGVAFAPTPYTSTITGTVAGQTTMNEAPVKPFSGVTIGDKNSNATDTLTITIGGSGGSLADGAGFNGLMKTGTTGVYTLYGSASAITSELDALVFTPNAGAPGSNNTSTFKLSDLSSASGSVTYSSTLTTLVSFDGTNGAEPFSGLTADASGDLFGTTAYGGANGYGTVYEIVNGQLTTLAYFDSTDAYSNSSLITDAAGDLFGTTQDSGSESGVVFEIAKTASGYGPLTTLASLTSTYGSYGALVSDAAGDLFGTTAGGGAYGNGTVFEIAKTSSGYGSLNTLVSFDSADGEGVFTGLVMDAAGDLFAITNQATDNGAGTIYEIAKTGSTYSSTPITIASFASGNPVNVILDTSGDLFGLTESGGASGDGTVFEIAKTGSSYGSPVTLATFDGANGYGPLGGLVMDAAGDLFGTTQSGGAHGDGTVFEIAKTGSTYGPLTTLYSFDYTDGESPVGTLTFDAAGDLYGTTTYGGADGYGTVFEIATASSLTPTVDTTTSVVDSDTACYCLGTLILTNKGEVEVERLAIGDHVVTASGQIRPIKWIGRRSYSGRFVLGRKDILPVCLKAGSIADNVPKRDLWISPHHAMFIDGMLIEAKDLVNGISIVQAQHADQVDYFHVELESHDVIIAEGAASESYIDDDSRGMFHNAREFAALYPEATNDMAMYCAPRI